MAYCSNCGSELEPGSRFCSNCGKPVSARREEAEQRENLPRREADTAKQKKEKAAREKSQKKIEKQKKQNQPQNLPMHGKTAPAVSPVMPWICLIIGILILAALWFILKLSPEEINNYSRRMGNFLSQEVMPYSDFELDPWVTGKIIIAVLIVGAVTTAFMLPLRITKVSRKAVTLGDRLAITVATYFWIAFVVFLYYFIVKQNVFSPFFRGIMRAEGGRKLMYIGLLVVLILLLAIPVFFIYMSSKVFTSLIRLNVQTNGVVIGILSSIYDVFSSVAIIAALLAVVCFGIGMCLGLILLIGMAFSDGRRVVKIDGKYYYVD